LRSAVAKGDLLTKMQRDDDIRNWGFGLCHHGNPSPWPKLDLRSRT